MSGATIPTVTEQLRHAIDSRGLGPSAVGRMAELDPSVVRRFMDGRDLRLQTVDRLAAALGLRLAGTGPT